MGDQWMEGEWMTSSERCRSGKLQEESRDVPGGGKEEEGGYWSRRGRG